MFLTQFISRLSRKIRRSVETASLWQSYLFEGLVLLLLVLLVVAGIGWLSY